MSKTGSIHLTSWGANAVAHPMFIAACFWYSALYVVVEGRRDVGFSDATIDPLLADALVKTLKRYRHGVCHFQRNYDDARFMDLIIHPGSVQFVWGLHTALFYWFRAWGQLHLPSDPPPSAGA